MRSTLLAGTAVATLLLAAPSISIVPPEDGGRRGEAALDPLTALQEMCRPRAADGPLRHRLGREQP